LNLTKLRRLVPPDWNERIYSVEDFDRFCPRDGVCDCNCRMRAAGLYVAYSDVAIILLSERQRGLRRRFVQMHELGHHWLHTPGLRYFSGLETKQEFEANSTAICALLPLLLLLTKTLAEIAEEYSYLCQLIARRMALF
jgi:Zn-dependent peptidase ImmA (M78 family)